MPIIISTEVNRYRTNVQRVDIDHLIGALSGRYGQAMFIEGAPKNCRLSAAGKWCMRLSNGLKQSRWEPHHANKCCILNLARYRPHDQPVAIDTDRDAGDQRK